MVLVLWEKIKVMEQVELNNGQIIPGEEVQAQSPGALKH